VADDDRGVLVGATSAGPVGGEVLSMLTLAAHAAAPIQRLLEMIYAYPIFHRDVLDAAGQLTASLMPARLGSGQALLGDALLARQSLQ
jgi:hypothetical protein